MSAPIIVALDPNPLVVIANLIEHLSSPATFADAAKQLEIAIPKGATIADSYTLANSLSQRAAQVYATVDNRLREIDMWLNDQDPAKSAFGIASETAEHISHQDFRDLFLRHVRSAWESRRSLRNRR
jgi:hypothetical protein